MNHIYKNAAHVVVSLGEANAESDAAMDSIYPLVKAMDRIDDENSLQTHRVEPSEFDHWRAIGSLLSTPWFERIRVLQEVAIGPEPLFVCGTRAVDWPAFCTLVIGIAMTRVDAVVSGSNEPDGSLWTFPPGLINVGTMNEARSMLQKGEWEPLQLALLGMNHFKATDSRDKVYALLTLAGETDGETIEEPLQPDYESAPLQIYQRVARHLLLRDPHIYILNKAGISSPKSSDDLPSWVPRFRNK